MFNAKNVQRHPYRPPRGPKNTLMGKTYFQECNTSVNPLGVWGCGVTIYFFL